MTKDEIKELDEQIAEAGGAKYANSFTVISDPHDMSILFMTHEVPTTCVTISYKACHRLIELLQEALDSAKAKEKVSAENVPQVNPNMGATLKEALAEAEKSSPAEACRQWLTSRNESAAHKLMAMGYVYKDDMQFPLDPWQLDLDRWKLYRKDSPTT